MRHLFTIVAGLMLALPAVALDFELATTQGGSLYFGSGSDEARDGFLVDTGSSYVILTAATFKKIRQSETVEFLRDIRGAFADGRQLSVPVYRVSQLTLAQGCTLANVEVALVKGANRNILGMSGLRLMQPFTLGTSPPILSTPGCS